MSATVCAPETRVASGTHVHRASGVLLEGLACRDQVKPLVRIAIPVRKDIPSLISRFKEIFKEEGVPPEWVWLVEVESKFDPHAISRSGATGLFQFMAPTANRFGLRTDVEDDRYHPEKSARAAARYLRFLYEEFGTWRLALAAYNAGEGCVGRLLKKHGARSFDEIAFDLPAQTRFYVAKVLEVARLRESQSRS